MKRHDNSGNPVHTLCIMALMAVFVAGCGGGGGGNDNAGNGGSGGGNGGGDGGGDGGGGGGNPGPAGASPDLGSAGTYGVFASNGAVTLAVDSLVIGDVGLNPAAACNNCVVGVTVDGAIHNGDFAAREAQTDFRAAYTDASTRATNACAIADGELSSAQADCGGVTPGPVYGPGLYRTANPIGIGVGFSITLDAAGNEDAVFIFQTDSAITTGTDSRVFLAGGAQAKNVWWMAGSAATLGVSSAFKGSIIANGAGIRVLGGTILDTTRVKGRLFSSAAAVTVDAFATVTVPE